MSEDLGVPESQELLTEALLAGLEDYDLQADDLEVINSPEPERAPRRILPVVAIVGRPNVGKSTLVNRILGHREAVVLDQPGVTRDRVTYDANWAGRDFHLVDTGGWETDLAGVEAAIARQAEAAIDNADVVVFMVDATVGITSSDEQIVPLLRKSGKPVVLAANRVDNDSQEADATGLWALGLGEPYPISALHGRGSGELLDAVIAKLPEEGQGRGVTRPDVPRVALVGRPNVGKSSLLNRLAGSERVIVDDTAGTTRDPVDEVIELDGREWIFVDTAGIRRRQYKAVGADYYSQLRTTAAIENADLALVLLDASATITDQDVKVIGQVVDAGRALVVINNKWDQVDEYRQDQLKLEREQDLGQISWAQFVNISALTGWHTNRLSKAMEEALDSWQTRIPTAQLNSFLGELVAEHPHPLRGGKQPRILFATQAGVCPPRFVLFTTGFLDPGYRRFIERRLRETFGFVGTPVQIGVRVREKKRR